MTLSPSKFALLTVASLGAGLAACGGAPALVPTTVTVLTNDALLTGVWTRQDFPVDGLSVEAPVVLDSTVEYVTFYEQLDHGNISLEHWHRIDEPGRGATTFSLTRVAVNEEFDTLNEIERAQRGWAGIRSVERSLDGVVTATFEDGGRLWRRSYRLRNREAIGCTVGTPIGDDARLVQLFDRFCSSLVVTPVTNAVIDLMDSRGMTCSFPSVPTFWTAENVPSPRESVYLDLEYRISPTVLFTIRSEHNTSQQTAEQYLDDFRPERGGEALSVGPAEPSNVGGLPAITTQVLTRDNVPLRWWIFTRGAYIFLVSIRLETGWQPSDAQLATAMIDGCRFTDAPFNPPLAAPAGEPSTL